MTELDDKAYLQLALDEARKAFEQGDFPVGATLVIDGKLVGTARNLIKTNANWVSHAESELMWKYAGLIKQSRKQGSEVTIFTSLEPCLMCFGTMLLNRITRVVYSCPDPYTGGTNIDPKSLNPGYAEMWTKVEQGALKDESKDLVLASITSAGQESRWAQMVELLKDV
jgi:tRNA(adenine34) deaminase